MHIQKLKEKGCTILQHTSKKKTCLNITIQIQRELTSKRSLTN